MKTIVFLTKTLRKTATLINGAISLEIGIHHGRKESGLECIYAQIYSHPSGKSDIVFAGDRRTLFKRLRKALLLMNNDNYRMVVERLENANEIPLQPTLFDVPVSLSDK